VHNPADSEQVKHVEGGPGGQDEELVEHGGLTEGGQGHVAAERNGRQRPARARAIGKADEFRAEADRELRRVNADSQSGQVVAEFVDGHHEHDDGDVPQP
jgi:hypothetical protein